MANFLTLTLFVTSVLIFAFANGSVTNPPVTPANTDICDNSTGIYIIDPKDPHYYYECVGRGWQVYAYRFKCPANLIFNPNKNVCDYDPNVDKAPVTADPSVPHSKTFDCKGKNDGFYADEHDRHKFHECSKGFATDFTCSPNTVFIPTKNVCDHESAL